MKINRLTLTEGTVPQPLAIIPSPPKVLYHRGAALEPLLARPRLAIVGTRSISTYGKQVTRQLARDLAGQGIVIISGLALGVDALVHEATLEAGGTAIAVLPGPVDRIAPVSNTSLAERILAAGGALISEYEPGSTAYKANFVARNRLVAGLCQALLITEAAEKSGSLHTARFALEQGKDVLAVPGDITRIGSVGTNNLIKTGAAPVTSYLDVLHVMELQAHQTPPQQVIGRNRNEQKVLELLLQGIRDGDILLNNSSLSISEFNQVLTMLEVGGKIRALGSNQWALL